MSSTLENSLNLSGCEHAVVRKVPRANGRNLKAELRLPAGLRDALESGTT